MQRHVRRLAPAIAFGAAMLIAFTPAMASGQPAKRAITLDDLAKIKSVGDPQRSPDGKWVAYVVGSTDVEKDKRDTDLWMVSWDGAQTVRLTSGPRARARRAGARTAATSRSSPAAAPRTRRRRARRSGCWTGWAARRRSSPTSRAASATTPGRPTARGSCSRRATRIPADEPEKMEGWKRKTAPPIVIDRYHFKQDRDGYLKRFYTPRLRLRHRRRRRSSRSPPGRSRTRRRPGRPTARRIAFVSTRQGPDPDRHQNSDIYVVEAKAGAEPKQLTTFIGARRRPAVVEPRRPVDRLPPGRRDEVPRLRTSTSSRSSPPPAARRRS